MSEIPKDLLFTSSHEWIRDQGDQTYVIGITDYAQSLLGDVVYVDLPELGAFFSAGDDCTVIESVKAASDVYTPLSGEIISINEELEEQADLVNTDPYTSGWLFQVRITDATQLNDLLTPESYEQLIAEQ